MSGVPLGLAGKLQASSRQAPGKLQASSRQAPGKPVGLDAGHGRKISTKDLELHCAKIWPLAPSLVWWLVSRLLRIFKASIIFMRKSATKKAAAGSCGLLKCVVIRCVSLVRGVEDDFVTWEHCKLVCGVIGNG